MFEHKRRLLTCAAAAVLSLYGAGASAFTERDKDGSSDVVEIQPAVWTEELGEVALDQYTHEELAQMVDDYWTKERLRNATPVEMPALDASMFESAKSFSILKEEPEQVLSEPALPTLASEYAPYAAAANYKSRVNGKIVFRNPQTGRDGYCSGAAINSGSKRLVITAAQCVHSGGPGGVTYQNWRFMPDYHIGPSNAGTFWQASSWVLSGWLNNGGGSFAGYNSDVAFVATHSNANGKLVDVVGGHGLTIGGGYVFYANIFGYPLNSYNAQVQQNCQWQTGYQNFGGYGFLSAYGCNFGAVAFGGPWLDQYNNSTGIGNVRSVSSFKAPNGTDHLYGPYFTNSVLQLYLAANAGSNW